MKNDKKVFIVSLFLNLFILLPLVSSAQVFEGIPCDGVQVPCDFNKFMQLIQNIINFVVLIAFPLAVISFTYAGFTMMMNPGNSTKRSDAIKTMQKVAIGFGVLLAAWLIVKTIMEAIVKPEIINNAPIQF